MPMVNSRESVAVDDGGDNQCKIAGSHSSVRDTATFEGR